MNISPIRDQDAVWRALANPLRRSILDQLREGPRTTGEIVDGVGLGRHVVVQHLAVLREAELVLVEKRGRQRLNHLNAVPIQQIYERWVSQYAQPWVAALVGLEQAVRHEQAVGDEPAGGEESGVG